MVALRTVAAMHWSLNTTAELVFTVAAPGGTGLAAY